MVLIYNKNTTLLAAKKEKKRANICLYSMRFIKGTKI